MLSSLRKGHRDGGKYLTVLECLIEMLLCTPSNRPSPPPAFSRTGQGSAPCPRGRTRRRWGRTTGATRACKARGRAPGGPPPPLPLPAQRVASEDPRRLGMQNFESPLPTPPDGPMVNSLFFVIAQLAAANCLGSCCVSTCIHDYYGT